MASTTINPGRLIIGLALVAAGALFLLDQAGTVDAGSVLTNWWPVAIIFIGLVQLALSPRAILVPVVIMLIGALLLGSTLDLYSFSVWDLIWPSLIIVVGLAVMFGRGARLGLKDRVDSRDRVHAFAAFSGSQVVSHSDHLTGADVTTIFGGAKLDLRHAKLAPEGAVIDVTSAFGGADIIVPYGWNVVTNGLPIFGGFDNKTADDEIPEDAPRLLVRGTVVFGGIAIKHKNDR